MAPPLTKEIANAQSALDHSDFVSAAVVEMVAVNVVTLLPLGEKPLVVSPLGVVPKPRSVQADNEYAECKSAFGKEGLQARGS